jgi:hypothetical protein
MEGWNNGTMERWTTILIALAATSSLAAEPKITCEPRELRGVPGEPLQLELAVETDRPARFHLRIPAVSNLVLRTIEKTPIQRKKNGRYVQKRILIWQGLEAGSTTITNLTAVFQTLEQIAEKVPAIGKGKQAATQLLPSIGITIDEVVPAATPPSNPPRPSAFAPLRRDGSATPPAEGNKTTSTVRPLLWRGAGTAGWFLRFPEATI